MKILLVSETDWIKRGPHQQHHMAERMIKRGHDVRVIDYDYLWRENKNNKMMANGFEKEINGKVINDVKIKLIRPSCIHINYLDKVTVPLIHKKEIEKQLEEFRPDVIVAFGILNANVALKLAKKNGCPFVYYVIDHLHTLLSGSFQRKIAKRYEMKNIKGADLVLVINKGLKDYVIEMGAKEENTKIITAGVDLEKYNQIDGGHKIRKQYDIKKKDLVLFFMGWIYDFSGMREVALELAKNKNKYTNIKLLIVGEGDLYQELLEIRKNYNLYNNLILTGKQPYEEIPKFLAASDICLLPAYNNEIMRNIVPIKMYEYMAAGKPVIATKLEGIMKEFGEDNGVIYVDKPENVINKSINMTENGDTEKYGKKSRRFVESHSWEKVTTNFEEILRGLI